MKNNTLIKTCLVSFFCMFLIQDVNAAVGLDRTRVIFNGDDNSESLGIYNQNKTLPYLAQAWIEDDAGNKTNSSMLALPPLQRIEPGAKGQIKIQRVNTAGLPKDRESLFYFNLREIPPKSKKANTLQIALQTRVKLFFRPAELVADNTKTPQKALTMSKKGDQYIIHNPTGYFVTFVHAAPSLKAKDVDGFKAEMVPPKSDINLKGSASKYGNKPVLTFINDYGGRPKLVFNCNNDTCKVTDLIAG